jgi:uncharacterized membrane protein
MDKRILLALLGIVCLAAIVIYMTPLNVETKEMHVAVVSERHVGINLDTDKIYFGSLPAGGSAARNITISNEGSKKRFVLSVDGPMQSWVVASQSKFILADGERKTVTLQVSVPENTSLGNYTSNLVITTYRTI